MSYEGVHKPYFSKSEGQMVDPLDWCDRAQPGDIVRSTIARYHKHRYLVMRTAVSPLGWPVLFGKLLGKFGPREPEIALRRGPYRVEARESDSTAGGSLIEPDSANGTMRITGLESTNE